MMDIRLNSNYTITGDIEGTWEKSYDSYVLNVVIDNKNYRGVFLKQDCEFENSDKFSFYKSPVYKFDFDQKDAREIMNKGNKYGNAYLVGNAKIVNDEQMGQVLEIKNDRKVKKENYVKLPEDVFSEITHSGFCISMWVKADLNTLINSANSALFEANCGGYNKYPMTRIGCNLNSRINSNGICGDATRILGKLSENTWHQIAYSVGTREIIVYIDGKLVCKESKDMTSCFNNNVLSQMTQVTIGAGDIWGDCDVYNARFKNVDIYDLALGEEEINYIYRKEKSKLSNNNSYNINANKNMYEEPIMHENKNTFEYQNAYNKEPIYNEPKRVVQNDTVEKQLEQSRSVNTNTSTAMIPNRNVKNNMGTNPTRSRNMSSINENPIMNNRSVNSSGAAMMKNRSNPSESTMRNNRSNNEIITRDNINNSAGMYNKPLNDDAQIQTVYSQVQSTYQNTYESKPNVGYQAISNNYNSEYDAYTYNNRIENIATEEQTINNYEYEEINVNNYKNDNITSSNYTNEYSNDRSVERVNSNYMDNNYDFTSTEISVANNFGDDNYYDPSLAQDNYSNEYYNNNYVEDENIQYGYNGNTYIESFDNNSQGIVSGYDTSGNSNHGLITLCHDEIMRDDTNVPVRNSWLVIEEKVYCTDDNGKVRVGWFEFEDKWYHFNYIGQMDTGWLNDIDEKWYYLGEDGVKRTAWIEDANGRVYYLGKNGDMQIGWIKDEDGSWYYFYSNGEMAVNTIIDGYKIGWNGVCIR